MANDSGKQGVLTLRIANQFAVGIYDLFGKRRHIKCERCEIIITCDPMTLIPTQDSGVSILDDNLRL